MIPALERWAERLIIPLAVSLTLGFADAGLSIGLREFGSLTQLGDAATSAATTATCSIFLFAVFWLLLTRVATKRWRVDFDRASLALSSFLVLLVMLARLAFVDVEMLVRQRFLLVACILITAGGFACAIYRALPGGWSEPARGMIRRAIVQTFLLVVALFVITWCWYHFPGGEAVPLYRSRALLVVAVLLAVVLMTIMLWRFRQSAITLVGTSLLYVATGAVAVADLPSVHRVSGEPVTTRPAANAPKRIILISIDTLRRDAISHYHRQQDPLRQTPSLDAIAKGSTVFENAFASSPWTLPSVSAFMTGALPGLHLPRDAKGYVSSQFDTLAELLRANGYRTAAVGANNLLASKSGLEQGFDYFDFYASRRRAPSIANSLLARLWPATFSNEMATSRQLTDISIQWMQQAALDERPFFLWLHYLDPHFPYTPPKELLPKNRLAERHPEGLSRSAVEWAGVLGWPSDHKKWARELYNAEVSYVDAEVGRLIAAMKEMELFDDALLLVVADHGEEFWEHERLGHGRSYYNEVVRVPFFVKLPGQNETRIVESAVATAGIYPTVLELAEIPIGKIADRRCLAAGSFAAQLTQVTQGEPPVAAQPIIQEGRFAHPTSRAVVSGNWKMISDSRESDDPQLFDLLNDPAESRPLSGGASEVRRRLLRALEDYGTDRRRCRELFGLPPRNNDDSFESPVDPDTLRALGYVQ